MRSYLLFFAEIAIYIFHKFLRFFKIFSSSNTSEKIGIIVFKKLGDTVFVIPAIQHLVEKYKKENIVVFCYPSSEPIIKESLDLKVIVINPNNFWLNGRVAKIAVRKEIAKAKLKVIYDLTCQVRSATAILGLKSRTFGHNDKYCSGVYDQFVNPLHLNYLIDRFLYIADPVTSKVPFDWDKNYPVEIDQSKKILIHPFAGWKAKEWNFKKFITLCTWISTEQNTSLIFEAGSVSQDVMIELKNNNIDFIETNSVLQLISEIKNCSIFVGNDSGPINIARLLGKPTFTIFGPVNPTFVLNETKFHKKINKIIPCSPLNDNHYCYTFAGRKGCPSYECMNLLRVEDVYSAFMEYLDQIDFTIKKSSAVI